MPKPVFRQIFDDVFDRYSVRPITFSPRPPFISSLFSTNETEEEIEIEKSAGSRNRSGKEGISGKAVNGWTRKRKSKRGGEGAKRVKKEGERIACVSYRLRASSHLRARTHSRGHLSRTHTPCSLSLSLFISVSLRRATTIRSGEKEEESHLREFPCRAEVSKTLGFRETRQRFHLDRRKINTSSGRVLRAPNTFHDVLSRHRTYSRFSSPIPLSLSLPLLLLFDEENIDGESSE